MLSPANFLVLDEPTNHLDIPSKEILEDALRSYEGTVLYVSHDRYFINKTATRILELKNSVLTNFRGNYDYYEENKDRLFALEHGEAGVQVENPTAVSGGSFGTQGGLKTEGRLEYEKKKSAYAQQRKLEKELKRLENSIEKAETELDEISEKLSDPANGTNAALLIELSEKKETLEEELLEMYSRLEDLRLNM
jgi:ATP-binding cassette subfamily F protein 3